MHLRKTIAALKPALAFLLLVLIPSLSAYADSEQSPFVVTGGGEGEPQGFEKSFEKLATPKEYYVRALKESDSKDYSSAVRDYTEAVKLNPHYGEALGNRGAAKFNLRDFNGALSDYNAALKIFPNNKALADLKVQAENAIKEAAAAPRPQQISESELARRRALLNNALLGGDMSDPSTIIMMNARRRGLIP